jgi:hypothetical protein
LIQKQGCKNKQEIGAKHWVKILQIKTLLHKSLCLIFTLVKHFRTIMTMYSWAQYLDILKRIVFQTEHPDAIPKKTQK